VNTYLKHPPQKLEDALWSLEMQPGPEIDRYSFELGWRAGREGHPDEKRPKPPKRTKAAQRRNP
jgi:hypothetical protein